MPKHADTLSRPLFDPMDEIRRVRAEEAAKLDPIREMRAKLSEHLEPVRKMRRFRATRLI